jgi:hypothetical protein
MTVIVDTDERSGVLPQDFLGVWRIWDISAQRWLYRKHRFDEGAAFFEDDELAEYWVWSDRLIFNQDLTIDNSEMTLYYYAYWPEIVYQNESGTITLVDEDIIVPQWAIGPLMHLTAAFCLQPGAIQAARTRQWNIRVDSGRPTDNSRAVQAREHFYWWGALMALVPPLDWR